MRACVGASSSLDGDKAVSKRSMNVPLICLISVCVKLGMLMLFCIWFGFQNVP